MKSALRGRTGEKKVEKRKKTAASKLFLDHGTRSWVNEDSLIGSFLGIIDTVFVQIAGEDFRACLGCFWGRFGKEKGVSWEGREGEVRGGRGEMGNLS